MTTSFTRETHRRRIRFGVGCIAETPEEIAALGSERTLVVTGGSASVTGRRVASLIGERCAGIFGEVRQHVPEELATRAVDEARRVAADALCSVGGGSATGLAKAVAIELGIPIVAIPTTYAGSEMTPVWGITGTHKRTGRGWRALPRTVIYDPELTLGLPPRVTASSGLNSLAHAVSVLLTDSDPIASLHAAEAARILTCTLPATIENPSGIEARTELLYGACLSADALGSGRLEGIHHRLCHIVGGTHRLTHADVHAVLLPHTLAHAQQHGIGGVERVAEALNGEDPVRSIRELTERIDAPTALAELGLDRRDLDAAIDRASNELTGLANEQQLPYLLTEAWAGRPPRMADRAYAQKGEA